MRPFLAEHLQTGLEFFQIIALAGHQMAAAEIDPFQTRQIGGKMRLESIYQMTGILGIGLAQGMAMETFNPLGHILRPGQVTSHDPQTGTGRTRVIDSLHMRMQFRIDPQAERNTGIGRTSHRLITMELVQRIESHMRTHPGHLFHLVLVIRGRQCPGSISLQLKHGIHSAKIKEKEQLFDIRRREFAAREKEKPPVSRNDEKKKKRAT